MYYFYYFAFSFLSIYDINVSIHLDNTDLKYEYGF